MTKIAHVVLPLLLGSLLIALPVTAHADPATPNFGQHVSACAQTMGFSADHNPGMHQGVSGWDGMPC
jgi:hypothetical protein